jgi:hypothetical protein
LESLKNSQDNFKEKELKFKEDSQKRLDERLKIFDEKHSSAIIEEPVIQQVE